MKIALSGTEIASEEGVGPLIDACDRLDVRWTELWYPRNTDMLGVQRTLDRLAEAKISVGCVGTATELGADGDVSEAQQTITEAIQIAARIGCGMVNTYFGWPTELDDERAIRIYRDNLLPCLRVAERSGVTLTLENEFDAFGHDPLGTDITRRPEAIVRLIETVGSEHFRVAFDPCNAYFADVNPSRLYQAISPYVAYMHLKDGIAVSDTEPTPADWKRFIDHGRHYVTCALGMGEVGWDDLFDRITEDGYDGLLALEPHSEREHLAEAWRHAAEFVRQAEGIDVG